jgi:hypothetical protein
MVIWGDFHTRPNVRTPTTAKPSKIFICKLNPRRKAALISDWASDGSVAIVAADRKISLKSCGDILPARLSLTQLFPTAEVTAITTALPKKRNWTMLPDIDALHSVSQVQ